MKKRGSLIDWTGGEAAVTAAQEDIAEAVDQQIQHEGKSRNPNDKKEPCGTVLEK